MTILKARRVGAVSLGITAVTLIATACSNSTTTSASTTSNASAAPSSAVAAAPQNAWSAADLTKALDAINTKIGAPPAYCMNVTAQLATAHNQERSLVVGMLTPDKDKSMTTYTYDPQSQVVSVAEVFVALTPEQAAQRIFKCDTVLPQVLVKVQGAALGDAGAPGGFVMGVGAVKNLKDTTPAIEAVVMVDKDKGLSKTVRYDLTGKLVS
ncbi:hypothetical protein [Nocardia sp. NPDC005998]|uniref:hypothetical protein n=1 Tax=Nocardia sp. NPDC005998 TaxID=3156894 RepID=UPI0033A1251A